jgi:hypothetical protein
MTVDEFRKTVSAPEPPALSLPLQALWWAARGDWARAHGTVDDSEAPDGMWVHAHLHRQEGDASNARYWYNLAKKPEFAGSIEEEWTAIAAELLRR